MTVLGNIDQDAVYCEATFNYADSGPVVQPVLDGRRLQPSFDVEGFELVEHHSQVEDWTSLQELDGRHSGEIRQLAASFTGCDDVLVYPAIVRSPASAEATPDYAPVELVHSDFTEDYRLMATDPSRPYREFIQPVLDAAGMTQDDLLGAARLLMLQLWRNTGPVQADRPLALCDVRDAGPERQYRFVVPQYGGRNLAFETMAFAAPKDGAIDHWHTFPEMQRHEVIAFRTYDSERERNGERFWTPHSAFRDPSVPATPEHRRESVEMRALCVWR